MISFLVNFFKVRQIEAELKELRLLKHDLELEVYALDATIKERTRLVDDWGKINAEHKATISMLLSALAAERK